MQANDVKLLELFGKYVPDDILGVYRKVAIGSAASTRSDLCQLQYASASRSSHQTEVGCSVGVNMRRPYATLYGCCRVRQASADTHHPCNLTFRANHSEEWWYSGSTYGVWHFPQTPLPQQYCLWKKTDTIGASATSPHVQVSCAKCNISANWRC